MPDRRNFLQAMSSVPFIGGLFASSARATAPKPAGRDYFKELNVRPFINGAGTFTVLTASLMWPEVVEAMNYASKTFVPLNDLQEAAGKRVAELIGCEAAMITSGAAAALTVGAAACVAGKNPDWIKRIPDLAGTGMKSEVIVQKSHRYGYDHAVRNCGVRMVEVETAEQLESAINPNTLMMLFFNANEPVGAIKAQQFVELGKKHNIPTFNDAAADVPPVENLSKYTRMGFDLVTFSGGKGLRGAGHGLYPKDSSEWLKARSSSVSACSSISSTICRRFFGLVCGCAVFEGETTMKGSVTSATPAAGPPCERSGAGRQASIMLMRK